MPRHFVRLSVLLTCLCFAARGQIGRATILGSITDASDAPIARAQIRITQTETNSVLTTLSNDFGLYRMPGLPVGHYEVDVTAPGFKREVRSGILLEVDDKPEINFRLEVGAVTESVEVT